MRACRLSTIGRGGFFLSLCALHQLAVAHMHMHMHMHMHISGETRFVKLVLCRWQVSCMCY